MNCIPDRRRAAGRIVLFAVAAALASAAQAQNFIAIDSISVRGIFFVGERDRESYGPADTVRARLVAFNPTSEIVTWPARYAYWPVMFFGEQWCNTSLDTCTAVDLVDIQGWGDAPQVLLPPGRTVLDTMSHASECPGDGWFQNYGRVKFANPWDYPYPFSFTLTYSRGTAAIAGASWTRIKALYR